MRFERLSKEGNSFSSCRERGVASLRVELCFKSSERALRWVVSLSDVESSVPEEPQVGCSKEVGDTDLELLREGLWLRIKSWEVYASRCVYG